MGRSHPGGCYSSCDSTLPSSPTCTANFLGHGNTSAAPSQQYQPTHSPPPPWVSPLPPRDIKDPSAPMAATTLSPPSLSRRPSAQSSIPTPVVDVNLLYAECPICYDDLNKESVCVLMKDNRRTCRHFYHLRCGRAIMDSRSPGIAAVRCCPMCRTSFTVIREVPDIRYEPLKWFEFVDFNGDGRLDKREVIELLKSCIRVDWRKVEANIDRMWTKWDHDKSGYIEKSELLDPQRGLVAYLRLNMPPPSYRPPPELSPSPTSFRVWFRYWDEDQNGTLDFEEVLRALIKTFNLSAANDKVSALQQLLGALWIDFDPDNDGHITEDEFSRPGGLANTVLANLHI